MRATSASCDLPALSRHELKKLVEAIAKANATDEVTSAHLSDMRSRIEQALDPRAKPSDES
jgi:hypothetical protein